MIRGILYTLVYYVICFGTAWLVYLNTENHYAHGPGLHHMLVILSITGGVFWFLATVRKFFLGQLTDKMKGSAVAHIVVLIAFAILMYGIIKEVDHTPESPRDDVTIEAAGDTIMVYSRGNIVYLKQGDSVHLDFIGVQETTYENIPLIMQMADSVERRETEIKRIQKAIDSLRKE